MAKSNGIETHGPYQHGAGWPAVNGDYNALDPFPSDTPPQEYPSATISMGQPNQFTSEFGTVTWSSFERSHSIAFRSLAHISTVCLQH